MQIFVRCTVVIRYFHENPNFVYLTVRCNNQMTNQLKIIISDRLTLLHVEFLSNTQFEMLATQNEVFWWRNENYRCLNHCRSNNLHRIKLKNGAHMP